MNKQQTILALIFATGLSCGMAQAMTLSLTPSLQTIDPALGEKAFVDLEISGLGENGPPSLGAFSVEITFNPSFLSYESIVYGSFLGDPGKADETLVLTSTDVGSIVLDEISFLDIDHLDALQSDSFVLATLAFAGNAMGNSSLDFNFIDLSDASGNFLIPTSLEEATVNVLPVPIPPPAVVPQFGAIKINSEWLQVNLDNAAEAVILFGPPTYNDDNPGVVRLRDKTDDGFQVRFEEWDYRERDFGDTTHTDEYVSYLVLPEGHHLMADDSIWEVGTFLGEGTGEWDTITFDEPFDQPPYVFLTIQTANGSQAVTARVRNVDTTQFEVAFIEEEFLMESGHALEIVGYVAVAPPIFIPELSGIGGFIEFGDRRVPYYLDRIQARHEFVDVVGARIKLEEEQSRDLEIQHFIENIDVLTLGAQVFAQQVSDNGSDTTAIRRQLGIE